MSYFRHRSRRLPRKLATSSTRVDASAPIADQLTDAGAHRSRRLRVLHVTPTFVPAIGGVENFIRGLCVASRDIAGIEVAVGVCSHGVTDRSTAVDPDGIRVTHVRCRGHGRVKLLPDMTDIVRGYDVVHLHDPQLDGITAHFALRTYGCAVVASTHGGCTHTRRWHLGKKLYARLVVPSLLRRLDLVIASGVGDERAFAPLADNLIRIDNGVDFMRFNAAAATWPDRAPRFAVVGRLARHKRVDLLLECFAAVRRQLPGAELHVVGGDVEGLLAGLQARCARRGLGNAVTFHGLIDDEAMLARLAQTRYFLTASEYEGFGLAVVEAMAAGRIPFVSPIDPYVHLVADGRNGFVVDFHDPGSAADRILAAVALGEAAQRRLSERAVERARDFRWETTIPAFVRAYERVLAAPSSAGARTRS